MLIIAGLGNPGTKYAHNRHNIGFMAADEIVRRHDFSPWKKRFSSETAEGTINGEKLLIMKPMTMMNLSGNAIGEAMRFFKLTPANVTVIYDELDLAPGKLRVKTGGGNGGHNGIKSTEAHIGKEFRRVRLGIGHPGERSAVINHVLGDFSKADQQWLDPFLQAIASELPLLLGGNDSTFMNRVALAMDTTLPGKAAKEPDNDRAGRHGGSGQNQPPAQSHIRQARQQTPKVEIPKSGPMAEMLKRLFDKK